MRNEKSLTRYREEQNLAEADMSLAGFVCIFNEKKKKQKLFKFLNRSFFIVLICLLNVV
jgi:hypothetical protein